ncbi:MAG: hypothetical protein KAG26_09245, partial [Methylococcales bacterium]|nr:hypothetical protein [Methylococcales bacterium]
EEWAKQNGLSAKALQILKTEELVSETALAALSSEDMASLGLTVGQRKLLELAVASLHQTRLVGESHASSHAQQASGDSLADIQRELENTIAAPQLNISDLRKQAGQLQDAGKTFDSLLAGSGDNSTVKSPPTLTIMSCFDPRLTLTMKAHKKKAVHITDFLHETTKKRKQAKRKQFVLAKGMQDSDQQLVFQTEDDHPYSGIFVSEWAAANCRLMNHLLQRGDLARQDIEYYLAHTASIMDFVDKYEWESILQFDYHYRELQAEHGFPWGTYPPNMEVRLNPKPTSQAAGRSSRYSATHRKDQHTPGLQDVPSQGILRLRERLQVSPRPPKPPRCASPLNQQPLYPAHCFPPSLPPSRCSVKKRDGAEAVNAAVPEVSLVYSAWESLLPQDYPKRDIILQGVRDGFHIIEQGIDIHTSVHQKNYKSALDPERKPIVEAQIITELEHGHYKKIATKPTIISALGAIPKKDSSKVRIIHDCSRPAGNAVNDYAYSSPFRFQKLQDAIDLIIPGCFLAKLDLANAYRSVRIHPSDYAATGLAWTFSGSSEETFMVDTRLPFGARRSPEIFHELSQAIRHIMNTSGHRGVVAYMDDFLLVDPTYAGCRSALESLMRVVRQLGFSINYSKVEGPTQRLTFLGITLDTTTMTMELPDGKIEDLISSLQAVRSKPKVTKRQLQSLAGKLNWATQCIYGGRFHLRRLLDRISTLRCPWHRSRVTKEMRADINWWLDFLRVFNGTMPLVDNRPATPISIDACTEAAGAYNRGDWVYTNWRQQWPEVASLHINFKEVLALEPAVTRWAPLWAGKKVFVHSDNQAAVAIINRGSCKNPLVMQSLRRVFWASAVFNFRLRAVYYPGDRNFLADAVSRLHERPGFLV